MFWKTVLCKGGGGELGIYNIVTTCVLEEASAVFFPFLFRVPRPWVCSFLYLSLLLAIKATVEGFLKLV